MPVAPIEVEFQDFIRNTLPDVSNFDELYSLALLTPYVYYVPNAYQILRENWRYYQEDRQRRRF